MEAPGLRGLAVLAFESRRAEEMAELIRRHGGTPRIAPSMREVPLGENPAALELVRRLEAGEIDVVILLTGVGTRALVETVGEVCPRDRFAALLGRTALVARGPKPVAALREMGLAPRLTAPEPNTWRELLALLDAQLPLAGKRVALQEYGVSNAALVEALAARAADLLLVPVYRWALPLDTAPLVEAIESWSAGRVDVVLFTSATQVHHVLGVARERGREDALRRAAATTAIASIGPVCSEALRELGLPVDLEPDHPKMGPLVRAAAQAAARLLAEKRARGA